MERERRLQRCCRPVLDCNLFETNETDERTLYMQRQSRRLCLTLLFMTITIRVVYTTFHVTQVQIEVKNPTVLNYISISEKFDNVRCVCIHVSISYRAFVELSYDQHQACSSDLILTEWIEFLFENNKTSNRYVLDFRATAGKRFQILRELCQVSLAAVTNGLTAFYSNEFITGELLSENLLAARVEADTSGYRTIVALNFERTLMFMRFFFVDNELITAIPSAYTLVIDSDDDDGINNA